jgi:hypothetical protein
MGRVALKSHLQPGKLEDGKIISVAVEKKQGENESFLKAKS